MHQARLLLSTGLEEEELSKRIKLMKVVSDIHYKKLSLPRAFSYILIKAVILNFF